MSKKHKNKKLKKEKVEEIKDTIPSFLKSNYIIYIILFLIMSISFYIRAIIPWNATFAGGVTGFAMDDSVYHMRLVENLIENFPNRLTYDAFTIYPYGSYLTWGSLYDIIIGSLILLFGKENIDVVGVLVPAVMGTLVVVPVYFIGKELLNKKAGLFAAFIIAILPGSFLQRSTLGFTDNHVAEVLFSTTFLMFTIISLNRVKDITIKNFIKTPITYIVSTPLKYSVFSGLFLGLYILTWTTGLIFSGIVAVFIILQIIINHITNKSSSSLLISTYIIYGISAILVVPFVDIKNEFSVVIYSFAHILAPLFVIVACTSVVLLSKKIKDMKVDLYISLLYILILLMVLYFIVMSLFPAFFIVTFGSLGQLFIPHTAGSATITEAQSTDLGVVSSQFGINFILSIISFIILSYYLVIKRKEKILLLIIWNIIILFALFAQNRFFYYFAINIAILSGISCGFILDYVGRWKNIKTINVWNIMSVIFLIFIVGFYPQGSSPIEISMQTTQYGVRGEGFYEWHESLTWMRNNTPDPGLDYYRTYEKPNLTYELDSVGRHINKTTYSYPETAYGVMSWWDYGHIITYWAHRIPNANPFQSGIGGGYWGEDGASTFLISDTEEGASGVLNRLGINGKSGAKYVVSNAYMAYSIQPIFAEWNLTNVGYFQQIRTSEGYKVFPTEKLYNTMESKLHIFDGSGLKQYRLIHESAPNQYVRGGSEEVVYKQIYNALINPNNPISIENSGYVKIFEIVKGANIVGKTTPNSEVEIRLNIITNINRIILYTQKTTSDSEGNYKLIVPYSTTGFIQNETRFDTKAMGKYELSIFNNKTIESITLDIHEADVLNGTTINI